MFSLKLEQFEGPLDLLLDLIEAEKLDISSVSLARVTDSYLAHVEVHPDIPPEELADFLVIASKLLYLKSKILLPVVSADEEVDLESQLRIYKEYVDATKRIEAMAAARRFMYVHDKLPDIERGFAPPQGFTAAKIYELFSAVVKRLEPFGRVRKAVIEKIVSIHEKIRHIQALLSRAAKVSFRALASAADSRAEIVVSFLALLELMKQRHVEAAQSDVFGDIVIAKKETIAA